MSQAGPITSGGTPPPPPTPSTLVKVVSVQTNDVIAITNHMTDPVDGGPGTITNTDGQEVMTLTITPANANNLLFIKVNAFMSYYEENYVAALFQDASVSPLCVARNSSVTASNICMDFMVVAGTVSPTTFRLRIGQAGTGVMFPAVFNGFFMNLTNYFAGATFSTIQIWEVLP